MMIAGNFIESLISERDAHYKRIEMINALLESYGVPQNGHAERSETPKTPTINIGSTRGKTIDEQIIAIVSEVGEIKKLKDWDEIIKKHKKTPSKSYIHAIKGVRNRGQLIAVKYNNANISQYYGLPEWIKGDGFGAEYIDASLLPTLADPQIIEVKTESPE